MEDVEDIVARSLELGTEEEIQEQEDINDSSQGEEDS